MVNSLSLRIISLKNRQIYIWVTLFTCILTAIKPQQDVTDTWSLLFRDSGVILEDSLFAAPLRQFSNHVC